MSRKSPVFYLIILSQILSTSNGRDKIFKVLQYSLKVSNWLRNSKSWTDLISTLSMTRKMIRLLNGLDPLLESSQNLDLETLNNMVSVVSDVADDVVCLAKLRVLDSKWGLRATPVADRAWFITILIDIYSLHKQDSSNLKKISMVKLIADLIFCSIDVSKLDPNPGWQNLSGLVSGSLGTLKLIQKKL